MSVPAIPRRVLVGLLRAVVLLGILLPFLGRLTNETTPLALAHNLDQRMNWIQYDAATRAAFDARIAANDLPLVRVGDELGMVIKVTPMEGTNTGAGGYVTFYIPNGAQVVDAAYLTPDGNGGFNRAPMKGQSIEPLGDGPIGAKVTTGLIGLNLGPNVNGQSSPTVSGTGLHLGTLAGVYGDTGIFYSTDPTTAWQSWVNSNPALGTSITNNRGETFVPNNKWDAMQMYAWGISKPTAPIIDPDGRGNSPWGLANGVAGPQSGYAWSFNKDFWDGNPGLPTNQRMQSSIAVGPWQRVKYPGSQLSQDIPGNQDNTLGFAEVDGSQVGITLNPGSPLPATTSQTDSTSPKAIRWSVGGLIINRPEYVYVKVKLLDPAPYTNCITMFDTDVVGGDAGGLDNAKDHLWRYYQPTSATMSTCVALSKRASREVVGLNGVFQYDIDVYNTSSTITLTNLQIQDTLPSGITYLSASPAPNSGPNPLLWTIPSLAPGQKFHATVTVKATSTGIKLNQVCATATNLNQTCSDEVTYIGNLPRLVQTKTASPTTINPGDPVQYTITINNIGTGATSSPMMLTDYLPAGFTYSSLNSVTLNAASAIGLTTVNATDPTKPTFTINGSINAGGSLILTFTTQTSPSLLPGQYCNTYYSTQAGTQITSGTEGCVTVGGGSIGDTVFRDWNGNGTQDSTDEGLPGVTLNLYAGACPPSGGVIKTATTDLDGKYLFTGLNAGSYCVDAPSPGAGGLPGGYSLTAGSDPRTVTLTQNEVNLNVDFGYKPGGTGVIGDLVFEDKGNDGAYNPGAGDVGLPNVTVNLYEDTNGDGVIDPSQDGLVATTTTNASGLYQFTGLATGLDYSVDVVDANITSYFGSPSWAASTGDPQAVPNLSGSYLNADFGFARVVPGSIGDSVFRDENKDGVYNAGDAPIPLVTVRLYQDTNGNGALDAGEPLLDTTVTDGAGLYSFTGLPAGKYIVDVDETDASVPGGYAPSRDLIPITLAAGQARTDADFPFVQVLNKTVSATTVTAGQVITYTITPSYPGNLPLSNLVVTDSIPAGATFVSAGQGGVLGSGYISTPGTAGYRPATLGGGSAALNPAQDTWVNEYGGDKNKNYGASTTLSVDGETGKRRHAVLQFDLSSLPPGATISSATLTLTKVGGDSKTSNVEVLALTESWGEGAKNGNTCSLLGEATWNTRDCFTPWTTLGGTVNGTSYATATVPATKTAVNWTVTSLVQAWANGSLANNGLLLQTAASSLDPKVTQNFASSENGTASTWPTLQINYTSVAGPDSGTTIGVSPTQVNPGGTFAVSMVLTSTGTINSVFPLPLTINGTNGVGATCSGPTPGTPQTLTPGPGLTFTWSCTATGGATAGELSITGGATGSGGYVFATASGDSVQVAPPGGNVVTWNLGSSCPAVTGVTAATGTALCPTSASLTSVADTYIHFKYATKNFGNATTMLTRPANASEIKHSLVRFDVSSIPAGAVIQSATLNLTVTGARSSNHYDKVYRLLTPWTEGNGTNGSGATWNTRDGSTGWVLGGFTSNDYDPTLLGTITPNASGVKSVDVTGAVDAWVNGGATNNGLAVLSTGTDGGDAKYATREDGTASRRPSLSVVYLLPTVGGCSGTVSATPQADTWMQQDSPNANNGTDNRLSILPNTSSNKQRISLMKFDLSGIPAGATISSATLSAQVNNTSNQWDANIYRMTTAWTETGATWNKRDGASGWASGSFSSSDYDATVYGPLDVSTATPPSVNVTSLVQAWVAGAPNEGIALLGNTQSTDEGKLYSREESNTSRRPLLTVNWTLPANPGAQTTTTLHVTPLLVGGSGQVVVTMQVSSSATVTGVTPPASLNMDSMGPIATLFSGPSPAGPVTVSPGNPATFTYVYSVTPGAVPANLRFNGKPTAPGATFATAYSECVIVSPPLTFRVQINNPATVSTTCNTAYIQDENAIPSTDSNEVCSYNPDGPPDTSGAIIGDTVYDDLNGNGVQDVGEPGLAGVQVCGTDGIQTQCASTNANGIYALTGLNAGSWIVTLNLTTAPTGFQPTTPTTLTVPLATFQVVNNADFGLQPPGAGSIGDTVWLDENNNGLLDFNENGLPNVTVKLYKDLNNNNVVDVGDNLVGVTATDASGVYTFPGLYAGKYLVVVDPTSAVTTPQGGSTTIGAAMTLVSGASPTVVNLLNGQAYTAADFGYNWGGTIGDTVFYDTNGNGVQNGGELGVPNATVDLYQDTNGNGQIDNGEPIVAVAFTNNSGVYLFSNVAPGKYVVAAEEQTVESPSTPGQYGTVISTTGEDKAVTLAPNQSFLNADFGFIERAVIGDTVFHDVNANGVQDAGEPGLAGVTVNLYDSAGVTLLQSQTTDANGNYEFVVAPGTYRVGVNTGGVPPTLNTATTPIVYLVTLASGQTDNSIDFGFAYSGRIGDTVFNDANGNGVQDVGESGLPNVTVQLYTDPNGDGNPADGVLLRVAATDISGKYLFAGLADGKYVVQVNTATTPAGWTQTADPSQPGVPCTVCDNRGAVTLSGGNSVLSQDFGYRAPGTTYSVSGTVYNDANGNAVKDGGEGGLSSVIVLLKGPGPDGIQGTADDVVLYSAVTDASGFYQVNGIPAGSNLTVSVSAGTLPSPSYVGTTPPGSAYTLTNIQSNITNRDFGYQLQPGSITGKVCAGAAGGVCQGADAPLSGVTVTLTGAGADGVLGTGDDTTTTTTTNGSGVYTFTNLAPGPYQISETNPPGYVSVGDADGGNPDLISVALAAGQNIVGQDFKDTPTGATNTPTPTPTATAVPGTGSVAGTVYNDLNGNGVKDPGETGIPAVTVRLYSPGPDGTLGTPDDVLVGTKITDGAGSYSFPNLTPGIYQVRETDPVGYSSTTPNAVAVVISSGSALTVNFGDQQSTPTPTPTATPAPPTSSVTGVVFNDPNGTGVQELGELGISGVTVQLLNSSNGTILATTVTSNTGAYSFNNLTPGPYIVREIDPVGYTSTTPNLAPVNAPAGGAAIANFGDQQVGTVSGFVFNDKNGDGGQDAGEPGIGGVTVQLVNPTTGAVVATTTTDPTGAYQFTSVTPGPYLVRETDPLGYVSTTPNTLPVSVPSGGAAFANFGDQQIGAINGTVFNDLNASGVQDSGEPGISGVAVNLYSPGPDGLLGSGDDVLIGLASTDGNGNYSFSGVSAGSYLVTETDPVGFGSTTPNSVPVTVPAGGAASANFGDRQLGAVAGAVTNDINGNGQADPGEPPIPGVTVRLIGAGPDSFLGTVDDVLLGTTTTDASGNYLFSSVTPGTYLVREVDPAGFVSTSPNAVPVVVPAGGVAHADFTDQMIGTLSGVVFNDLNGNGLQEPSEPGIGGVTVDLLNPNTLGVIGTTTTAGDGAYLFTGLPAGAYTVRETDPVGFSSTTPNQVNVTLPAGGAGTVNFGDRAIGTVSGVSFYDWNGNGVQDPGELGIGNVTVQLLNPNTLAVVATTTTAGDGTYLFTQVTPANYIVQEIDPVGFTSTTPNQVNVTVPAGGSASANFGNRAIGSVSGVVFDDVNGSAVQEPSESGLSGVLISLVRPGPDAVFGTGDDVLVASTTTLPDGSYQFLGVTAGPYLVRETDPVGFVSTTPNQVSVTVPLGGVASANFGDQLKLQPTAVQVTTLTATAAGSAVTVRWTTGTEVDVLGFQLWRSSQPDAGYSQVGAALIPSQAVGAGGAEYEAVETGLTAGEWYYQVAIVSLDGQVVASVGPVAVQVADTSAGPYRLFVPLIARGMR